MYEIETIPLNRRLSFESLTFPYFRPLLTEAGLNNRLVTIGASLLRQPVGLALAEIDAEDRSKAEIHSIAVAAAHRKVGLGYRLLQEMEEALAQRGVTNVQITYMSGLPYTSIIEKLLQRSQWMEPRYRMMVCESDMQTISEAPWMQERSFPPEFSVFQWCDRTAADLADLRERQAVKPWYPEELTPFKDEHLLEPYSSLGLRFKGQLIGWCLTHVLDSETVRYSTLFVAEEHQKMGRAIPLLACSITDLRKSQYFKARFDVALDSKPMIRFVKRRMSPYLLSLRYILRSYKDLSTVLQAEKRSA